MLVKQSAQTFLFPYKLYMSMNVQTYQQSPQTKYLKLKLWHIVGTFIQVCRLSAFTTTCQLFCKFLDTVGFKIAMHISINTINISNYKMRSANIFCRPQIPTISNVNKHWNFQLFWNSNLNLNSTFFCQWIILFQWS